MKEYVSNQENTDLIKEAAVAYNPTPPKYAQLKVIIGGAHPLNNEMDLIHISRSGLPKKTLFSLSEKLNISMERLSQLLNISHRTIQRKGDDDHLSVHVSEQILSIAEVIRRGYEVFDTPERFEFWVHCQLPSLNYKRPIDYLDTTFGTNMILNIMGRIEHGIY